MDVNTLTKNRCLLVVARRPLWAACTLALCVPFAGCERAWRNGFLDPTQVGRFSGPTIQNEIRKSLGPLEEPDGIQGTVEPTKEDLVATTEEARIARSDVLDVSVLDLLQPGVSTDVRRQVNESGYITLPVIGPIKVLDKTAREMEVAIAGRLAEQQILPQAEVSVTLVQSQSKRFSVVGNINRPGEYPISRPDFRLLDVVGTIGPLSVLQQKIYVFRGGLPATRTVPTSEDLYKRPAPAPPPGQTPVTDPFAPLGNGDGASLSDFTVAPASGGSFLDDPTERNASRPPPSPPPIVTPTPAPEVAVAGSPPAAQPVPPAPAMQPSKAPAGSSNSLEMFETAPPSSGTSPMKSELDQLSTRSAQQGRWVVKDGKWVQEPGGTPATSTPLPSSPATPTVTPTSPVASPSAPGASGGRLEMFDAPGTPATTARGSSVNWEALAQPETPQRIIEIPVEPLLNGDTRYNIVIRPNDVVNIPPGAVGEYYVTGHVVRPGAYSLSGRSLTVKEAIASAGGFSLLAWPSRCDLVRRLNGDQEEIRLVNLDRIVSGDEPDFFLKPNDILNVGTTAVAPFLATLRNSFRLSYGFGFVYDRNFGDEDSFFAKEQLRNRRQQERLLRGFPP